MRRRILSMFLAILLVVAMSLPVFAHAYTEYVDYANEMVEVNARCGGSSCRASTNTMSRAFVVDVSCTVYKNVDDEAVFECHLNTDASQISASVSYNSYNMLAYLVTRHFAGGHQIYGAKVYPSE